MNTPELLVSPTSIELIKSLKAADAFLVGEKGFSLRMPFYVSRDEIKEIITHCNQSNQKIYIALNAIFHEPDLDPVRDYLLFLKDHHIDGIVFGDLAVYSLAKEIGITNKLIYDPEKYITNYKTAQFFKDQGIKRVFISKEITLENINLIAKETDIETEILVHGSYNMFHSKRKLVETYFKYIENEALYEAHKDSPMYLIEEIRDELYPIVQDDQGTHVYTAKDMCGIEHLDTLTQNGIRSLKIDGIFKTDEQLATITAIYRKALDDLVADKKQYEDHKSWYLKQLNQIEGIRNFDSGFFFKKTIYKNKGERS
ncbi:peptidase U32 family protein [Haloplasma contractile]|uniref:Protease protein n=1 Tax=Haloplasma contractile SSD-17B TaxID=1033810 RepID=U2EFK8_9MOLU|nr:peptidase U32 family protein [Haloplasma contractile]ERJ13718.1 putative protease protein [Haloplasma contractile SSD-17B]